MRRILNAFFDWLDRILGPVDTNALSKLRGAFYSPNFPNVAPQSVLEVHDVARPADDASSPTAGEPATSGKGRG
ncbi:hypothetical protein [Pseudofrankia asymbiotica]|uniref:hypothetical protein n=1 Tax=Pseudofrankia asymbiotica TaxID=1834516 RepID=UPI0010568AF4|nr:hypothetical protein [Pseudofrankia asymbiotica]